MPLERNHYKVENKEIIKGAYSTPKTKEIRTKVDPANPDAVLVSSEVQMCGMDLAENGQLHAPALDIDFEARLIPSSTKGHYHLYLEHKMTWRQYKKLLKVMGKVGILEKGYVKVSLRRKATFLRMPGVTKQNVPLTPRKDMSYAETKAQEFVESVAATVKSLRKSLQVATSEETRSNRPIPPVPWGDPPPPTDPYRVKSKRRFRGIGTQSSGPY